MANSKNTSTLVPSSTYDEDQDVSSFFQNMRLDEAIRVTENQTYSSRNNNALAHSTIPSYFPKVPQIYDHYNLENNCFLNAGSTAYQDLHHYASRSSVTSNNYFNFEPTTIHSAYRYSLMSNVPTQVRGGSTFAKAANGHNHMYNNGYSTKRVGGTRSNGPLSGYEHIKHNKGSVTNPISLLHNPSELPLLLDKDNIMSMAMNKEGSIRLQCVFYQGNLETRRTILVGVLDDLPRLMSDRYGQYVFQLILRQCSMDEVQKMLEKLSENPELLVKTASEIHGSNSIQNLVKKIKKSPLGSYLTAIMAPGIVGIATTVTGRHAFKKCLSLLSHQANKVLYEEAIKNFDILAVHETGCLALNDCIDYVSKAEQRDELLQLVLDKAVFLAYDPSGNFIVQHAIALKNPDYSAKICEKLKGHYAELSAKKFGSHFVEKCIESCIAGMINVVVEILEKKKVLDLAKNEYGNYVIQKALETTRVHSVDLCLLLIDALLPNLSALGDCRNSRMVVEKIKSIRDSFGMLP